MKVCMVSYSQYHDSRVLRYASSLSQRGDHVDIVCLGSRGDPRRDSIQGMGIYRLKSRRFDESSKTSYLKKWIAFFTHASVTVANLHFQNRYDIIHYHNIPNFGLFCTLVPKLMGAKVILDIHDIVPEYFMRKFSAKKTHPLVTLLRLIEKLTCAYADHVITVTHIWYQTLVQRSVQSSKCTVIMNTPDPALFKRPQSQKTYAHPFTLLYPGNLGEHFGVDTAIRAMGILHKKIPDIRLQIVGTGQEQKRLIELRNMLDLQTTVQFSHRRYPLEQIPSIIGKADVGLVPKRGGIFSDEALSTKLLEFAMMGLPIIVSRTKASEKYFDSTMVHYFNADDESDLARAVLDLYTSPNLRKHLIRNASLFTERHNWNKYQHVYFDLLDTLNSKN